MYCDFRLESRRDDQFKFSLPSTPSFVEQLSKEGWATVAGSIKSSLDGVEVDH